MDQAARSYRILVPHFFERFFDRESMSPQGDAGTSLAQLLGLLAVPGAFFVLVFRPLGIHGWDLVGVRYIFVSFSMIVMAFLVVFHWDALFPDRRDFLILTPLPLGRSTVFLAKMSALALFLGTFLVDINVLGVLFFPGIDSGASPLAVFYGHVSSVLAGGLFAALAAGTIRGLLITFLSGALLRRVSVFLQTLLIGVLVTLFFLTTFIGFRIKYLVLSGTPLVEYYPGFWFVGLYERLRPTVGHPVLRDLGGMAMQALGWVSLLFVATLLPGYRRNCGRALDTPEPNVSGPGRPRRLFFSAVNSVLVRTPAQRAVFYFIGETITRSMKHRLFLATYGGLGVALAVMTLMSGPDGLLQLPLTLSFILVSGLRAAFNFPSELRANWAFQLFQNSSPSECWTATRKWIYCCAILPLFTALAPVEFIHSPAPVALFHLAFGIALSALLTEVIFFGFLKIPFTCSYFPGKYNLVGLTFIYVFGFTMYSRVMAGLEAWLSGGAFRALLFLAIMTALCWSIARLRSWQVAKSGVIEYEDSSDPVIRTLNLAPPPPERA
jgi:hypothetical protein